MVVGLMKHGCSEVLHHLLLYVRYHKALHLPRNKSKKIVRLLRKTYATGIYIYMYTLLLLLLNKKKNLGAHLLTQARVKDRQRNAG